jgi:hypothetical protein
MGFHGYGHTSCIIGECSIADCPEGPQTHYHSPDSTSCSHGRHHLHQNRTVVPRHRNDGPVDLSQYCTPTGRGTWSIGGRRRVTQSAPHLHIQSNSSLHITKDQAALVSAFSSTTQPRATFRGDEALVEQARFCQSTPNVDIPNFSSESEDAKDDRSNSDGERAELEKKSAALLNMFRATAFPLPVCQEHSHVCANPARILGTEKASGFSPKTVSSRRVNGDGEDGGMHGLDATGDTARYIGPQKPGINNTSTSQGSSTTFLGDRSSGSGYEGSSSTTNSSYESDNEIHEHRKGAVRWKVPGVWVITRGFGLHKRFRSP